jgi:hypothetical protein
MTQANLRNTPIYAGVLVTPQVKLRNTPIYVAVQPPAKADVRKVSGYALVTPPVQALVRKISGYALLSPVPITYLRMKGATALLTAINKEHNKTLTTAQVSFGDPSAAVSEKYNAQVAMIPNPTWDYGGQMVFRYTRYPLGNAFDSANPAMPAGSQTTVHGRLAAINATYNLNLETRDIVDGPVSASATGFVLTAASTSYLFVPGSKVTVGDPNSNNLATLITTSALNSFQAEG